MTHQPRTQRHTKRPTIDATGVLNIWFAHQTFDVPRKSSRTVYDQDQTIFHSHARHPALHERQVPSRFCSIAVMATEGFRSIAPSSIMGLRHLSVRHGFSTGC